MHHKSKGIIKGGFIIPLACTPGMVSVGARGAAHSAVRELFLPAVIVFSVHASGGGQGPRPSRAVEARERGRSDVSISSNPVPILPSICWVG